MADIDLNCDTSQSYFSAAVRLLSTPALLFTSPSTLGNNGLPKSLMTLLWANIINARMQKAPYYPKRDG